MDESRSAPLNSSHEWAHEVDVDHLAHVREHPTIFAPGGVLHLILEAMAYPGDEAEFNGSGGCVVTLNPDGSVSVADDGRDTDIRLDDRGRPVKKPVMATRDLRFFDSSDTELLPDGHPRRGMSVVAASSEWLIHTNRRLNGAWTQRYEHGIPVTELAPIGEDGSTGTTVCFRPDRVQHTGELSAAELARLAASWPHLSVDVEDRRLG